MKYLFSKKLFTKLILGISIIILNIYLGTGFIIPTHSSLTSCITPNQTKICDTHELYFEGFIDDSATTQMLNYKLTDNIYDQFGRPWIANQVISLSFILYSSGVSYPLRYLSDIVLAEEVATSWNGFSTCNSKELCCNHERRYFEKNHLFSYSRYEIGIGKIELSLGILISQGTFSTFITLSRNEKSKTFPGGELYILAEIVSNYLSNAFHGIYSFMKLGGIQATDLIVPDSYFCKYETQTNCLGMSELAYGLWLTDNVKTVCPPKQTIFKLDRNPEPWVSQIDGLNMKTSDILNECNSISFDGLNTDSNDSRMLLKCRGIGTLIIALKLKISKGSLKIQPNFGNCIVLDKGIRPFFGQNNQASLFITVSNPSIITSKIKVTPKELCIFLPTNEQSCSIDQLSSIPQFREIQPDNTISIDFPVIREFVTKKKGVASFLLEQIIEDKIFPVSTIAIEFDTRYLIEPFSDNIPGDLNCPPGYLAIKQGIPFCRKQCLSNDVFYSEETNQCVPVNCEEKYKGSRSFFNPHLQYCEPLAICLPSETYNRLDNICIVNNDSNNPSQNEKSSSTSSFNKSTNTTKQFEEEDLDQNEDEVDTNIEFTFPINCNGNGVVVNRTCQCFEGFKHPKNVDIFSMCTVQTGNTTSTSQFSGLLNTIISPTQETLILGASALVAIVCICICSLCGCLISVVTIDIFLRRKVHSKDLNDSLSDSEYFTNTDNSLDSDNSEISEYPERDKNANNKRKYHHKQNNKHNEYNYQINNIVNDDNFDNFEENWNSEHDEYDEKILNHDEQFNISFNTATNCLLEPYEIEQW